MNRSARLACLLAMAAVLASRALAPAAITERVSVSATSAQGNGESYLLGRSAVSTDGRFVAFASDASNLVPGDTNQAPDVFVRDRLAGQTTRVSVASNGGEANHASVGPAMTPDGRYVAFHSWASNLVSGDTNSAPDVFVHDCLTGATERVSVSSAGEEADSFSLAPAISADGRYVAFLSGASNLAPGEPGGLFMRDRVMATTQSVPLRSETDPDWFLGGWAISADARFVGFTRCLYSGDIVYAVDVCLRDRVLGLTERVDVSTTGEEADGASAEPSISADGRFVTFGSAASNLVPGDTNGCGDVFVRDRVAMTTELVSLNNLGEQADGDSGALAISADGRYVVFWSWASNLVSEPAAFQPQIYLRDRAMGKTQCVSRSTQGDTADGDVPDALIGPGGRYVAFMSYADNLVSDDTNGVSDVFLRDRLTFPDVPLDHWAFYEVEGCVNGHVVTGYPDGRYHPEEAVSRAQMAVYMARAVAGGDEGVPAGPLLPTFPDVLPTHWAYKYIEYCCDQAVVQGYWNGYHPDQTVNRAQMAVYVQRAFELPM